MIKIRAFENNEEKLIPISQITGSITRGREVFDITNIINDEITLANTPLALSEMVVVNGLVMTEGTSYDYVVSGNTITFNGGVLTQTGHVLINYSY